ncbi:MAG: rRNA maturation RNase YbeY [Actinobacteria bacterium]|nr:MAG: rRNA maturation RNase YbeY [Actinomycetota bacterium]TMM11722.1 MAG: rRNA maturation RNase YbeY [Actinomycetota bacterium]
MAVELEIQGTSDPRVRRAAEAALASAGVSDGHLAVAFVDEAEMQRLNREHRGRDSATDVLSFPVDGSGPATGPRELGDVVVCAALASDPIEAVVHGVLHLCGYDHETDAGEMLALQGRIMAAL